MKDHSRCPLRYRCSHEGLDELRLEPQHPEAGSLERLLAKDVVPSDVRPAMHPAVDLDDEAVRQAGEVDDDAAADGMLLSEVSPEAIPPESGPEERFAGSRVLAMESRTRDERKEARAVVVEHAPPSERFIPMPRAPSRASGRWKESFAVGLLDDDSPRRSLTPPA